AFFFFQAEDGIRDRNVTGVQTCALPIYENPVPLAGASVSINGQGDSWSLETDDEGFYQLFVPAAESPLEIEVSAEGHITASATEIGRASCRERVEIYAGDESYKKKKR